MQTPHEYIRNSYMQFRDINEIFVEYKNELMKMRGKVIDIGCGPGKITKEILLDLLPDKTEIVGADISEDMINYARKKYIYNSVDKRLSYVVLDIESLNLPSEHFEQYDYAISMYCLHWINDIWRAFKNIYQLLRPNGKTLVMFLAHHKGFDVYMRLKQNPRFEPYLQDADRYVPYYQRIKCDDMRASLQNMLEDIGFKILHCSKREKSFQFENKESLKNHACAVNPFIKRFPDENLKKEFLEELVNEIINQKNDLPLSHTHVSLKNDKDDILLRYHLLIAYVEKPSLSEA